MKRLMQLSLVLAMIVLVVTDCQERDSPLITDAPDPSPSLAVDINPGLVKVGSKHGNGPIIEEWIQPVIWDGVSPLETGVVYWFPSLEVERAAMAATSPQHLKWFEEMLQDHAKRQGKTKAPSPVLSVDDFNAYAHASVSGSEIKGRGQCFTQDGWKPPWDQLQHQIRIQTDSHGTFWKNENYQDGEEHYDNLEKLFDCPEELTVDAWVRTDGGTQDHAYDNDSCS